MQFFALGGLLLLHHVIYRHCPKHGMEGQESREWVCALTYRDSLEGESLFLHWGFCFVPKQLPTAASQGIFQSVDTYPVITALRLCTHQLYCSYWSLMKIKEIAGEEKLFSHPSSWLPHCAFQSRLQNSCCYNVSKEPFLKALPRNSPVVFDWAPLHFLDVSRRAMPDTVKTEL